MAKIRRGKMSFGSQLAKDHWDIEGCILQQNAIIELNKLYKTLTPSQLGLVKGTITKLKRIERKMRKQLIKDNLIVK